MSADSLKPLQPFELEARKRDFVDEFIQAANFGPPPSACRQLEKLSAENEPEDIVNLYIEVAGFGLTKRRD